jgi:hypothetical protein
MAEEIAIITSTIAMLASLSTIIGFLIARRKDHDETVRWMQEVSDRLDNHNHYAKMFNEHTDDISEIKQDVAFIKGQLQK